MTRKEQRTIENMKRFGGGFVALLAELWIRGDSENRRKIQVTWPKEWEKYESWDTTLIPVQKLVLVVSGADMYHVRRVDKDDHYGRNYCLTHDEDEPLVEFYWWSDCKNMSYDFEGTPEEAEAAGAKKLGYFVSRYNAGVFAERDPKYGLCLHGGGIYDKSYNIEPGALAEALDALGIAHGTHVKK